MYAVVSHFVRKYEDPIGTARAWKYKEIMLLLKKKEDLLVQYGIIIGSAERLDVNDDFLTYLLNIELDKETGHIPDNAIELYLQST
jgi:hypothetical protein